MLGAAPVPPIASVLSDRKITSNDLIVDIVSTNHMVDSPVVFHHLDDLLPETSTLKTTTHKRKNNPLRAIDPTTLTPRERQRQRVFNLPFPFEVSYNEKCYTFINSSNTSSNNNNNSGSTVTTRSSQSTSSKKQRVNTSSRSNSFSSGVSGSSSSRGISSGSMKRSASFSSSSNGGQQAFGFTSLTSTASRSFGVSSNNNNNNMNIPTNSKQRKNQCNNIEKALPDYLNQKPHVKVDVSLFRDTKGIPPVVWKGHPLIIDPTCDRYDELTRAELDSCISVRLMPTQYLYIKEVLLRATIKGPPFKKRDAQGWFRCDVNKINKIYDWFVVIGWIPPCAEGWYEYVEKYVTSRRHT